jgi:hypothetical protein
MLKLINITLFFNFLEPGTSLHKFCIVRILLFNTVIYISRDTSFANRFINLTFKILCLFKINLYKFRILNINYNKIYLKFSNFPNLNFSSKGLAVTCSLIGLGGFLAYRKTSEIMPSFIMSFNVAPIFKHSSIK